MSIHTTNGACVPARGSLNAWTTRGGAYGGEPVAIAAKAGRWATVYTRP